MAAMLILMRLIHILCGVFWAGTLIFNAVFLGPSIGEVGPDGGKVMAAIFRRGFLKVMPIIGLLTVLSGLWLYWHISGGFTAEWMRSRMAMTLGTGGVLAIVALTIGIGMLKPTFEKIMALGPRVAQAEASEREALGAELGRLRARATTGGRAVATLLALAAATMAVARYV